jgi:RimJ/RimL family protein N-acetyltransferase
LHATPFAALKNVRGSARVNARAVSPITNDAWRHTFLNGLPTMPGFEALALRTNRLDLLPITRQHAEGMFKVLNDPSLYEFTSGSPPTDVGSLARLYESWENRTSPDGSELWFNWALRLREEQELIGHVQVGVVPDHADVAWFLGSSWQHQGYATESTKAVLQWLLELGVREIRASINPAHAASIRVAERLGLQQTTESSGAELIWKRANTRAESPYPRTG